MSNIIILSILRNFLDNLITLAGIIVYSKVQLLVKYDFSILQIGKKSHN